MSDDLTPDEAALKDALAEREAEFLPTEPLPVEDTRTSIERVIDLAFDHLIQEYTAERDWQMVTLHATMWDHAQGRRSTRPDHR